MNFPFSKEFDFMIGIIAAKTGPHALGLLWRVTRCAAPPWDGNCSLRFPHPIRYSPFRIFMLRYVTTENMKNKLKFFTKGGVPYA
ncbi:hypothetical protein KL86CLO1_13204 [uncultured Eubacteriales bacterium]|uniref:Uncharacterized protein n=1 Tax=uncultured Eubacteriales bacterium TaxID=172733 RepID=A0A212KHN7_9FIRM|nr:hypothetical protein KL86CLO1_13204 [uncultured Eubacteriales bacterium]